MGRFSFLPFPDQFNFFMPLGILRVISVPNEFFDLLRLLVLLPEFTGLSRIIEKNNVRLKCDENYALPSKFNIEI